jgi:hypothetical protein
MDDIGHHQETEEEYDARLEREEKERIAARKVRELAAMKQRYEEELKAQDGGVRFKGEKIHILSWSMLNVFRSRPHAFCGP